MGLLRRVCLFVLVVLLVACGGEDGETTTMPADSDATVTDGEGAGSGEITNREDLVAAATTQFDSFLARDDETYFELLSATCRERLGFAAVVGHLDGRHFTAGLDGVDMTALSVSDVVIEGGGDTARVNLVIDGPSGEQFREVLPHTWLFEDGGWHMDDCADFREAQGGLEGVGTDRNEPLPLGGVADVKGWLVALTSVTSDGEDFIVETGGSPAAEGNQLFTAQISITYNGSEPSIVVGDELAVSMVNGDTVYGDEADCGTTDHNLYLDPATSVGPGELAGNPIICREVVAEHSSGLLLRVKHIPTGGEWWFSLAG